MTSFSLEATQTDSGHSPLGSKPFLDEDPGDAADGRLRVPQALLRCTFSPLSGLSTIPPETSGYARSMAVSICSS